MTEFKYLGRVLMEGDDDWLAVVGNLSKLINSWGRLSRILIQEGVNTKVSGNFKKRCLRMCCCLGRRHGCLPLGCSGPWIASSTGSRDGSPGGSQGDGGMGVGPTHHWRRQ